jgi:hypothetical protein
MYVMGYAPGGTFTSVERDRASAAGSTGGRSKSRAKVRASQRNGISGGRPPSRTLAERLLGRTLSSPADRAGFNQALNQLLQREQQELADFYGVGSLNARIAVLPPLRPTTTQWRPPLKGRARERALRPTISVAHSKEWRQRLRRPPREIHYLIRKLKLAASQFIPPR